MQQTEKGRAVQEGAVELDSGHLWKLPGLGTGKPAELEGGEPKPLAMLSFLSGLRSPSQGRSDQIQIRSAFAAPAPRAREVSVAVVESSGEGQSHQLSPCSD